MSDDPIGDALRADAEAARAEIRAEGIVCPSCGVNLADLPDGHALEMTEDDGPPPVASCTTGSPVRMAEFAQWTAAANIQVWGAVNRQWDEYARKHIIGEGPADFTGLLGALGQ